MTCIPRAHFHLFVNFIHQEYGAELPALNKVVQGILAKGLVAGRVMSIQELPSESTGQKIEICCSDKEFLKSVEEDWNLYLFSILETDDESQETDVSD